MLVNLHESKCHFFFQEKTMFETKYKVYMNTFYNHAIFLHVNDIHIPSLIMLCLPLEVLTILNNVSFSHSKKFTLFTT